jgi:hypothetical protein
VREISESLVVKSINSADLTRRSVTTDIDLV